MPPEEPKANGKAAPGDAKKAGKVVFGGGNRLLAAKVPRPFKTLTHMRYSSNKQ